MQHKTQHASFVETYGTNVFSFKITFNLIKITPDAINVFKTFIANCYI
jgi:hypothetical protein